MKRTASPMVIKTRGINRINATSVTSRRGVFRFSSFRRAIVGELYHVPSLGTRGKKLFDKHVFAGGVLAVEAPA